MPNNKVSIIIPVYNSAEYLDRCLSSIINQTHKNIEIILINDASTDNSLEICKAFASIDERIIILSTVHKGAYGARNAGLDIATGDYIAFVDADDWIEPNMYERLLSLSIAYNSDISQCEACNEGKYKQLRSYSFGKDIVIARENLTEAFFKETISHNLWSKLFKSCIWETRRFEEKYYHMDAAFISLISEYCEKFVRCDDVLYHYNTDNASITRSKKTPKHIQSAEKLFEFYSNAAHKNSPSGSIYICREIPSRGWLILPNSNISVKECYQYIKSVHLIFTKHWGIAKLTKEYASTNISKRLLWHLYSLNPHLASLLTAIYINLKGV